MFRRILSLIRNYIVPKHDVLKSEEEKIQQKVNDLEKVVRYLEYENSRLSSLMRYIAAPVIQDLPVTRQTRQSFDFQWDKIPEGRFMLSNKEFRKEAPGYVCQFTSLPKEWFKNKRVVDVGCGLGRYSWALCTLGAEVLSLDQSEHGLRRTQEACKEFPAHRTMQIDLLKPLPIDETFDLVWCFGVLHHTGDTYTAFKNIIPFVRQGGYLFLMIYGEPRKGIASDYAAVNEYEYWRRKTRNMNFAEKVEAITRGMEERAFAVYGKEHIHGYFDAISPTINDLYSWEEIEGWLVEENFREIKRTVDNRNHHIIARKLS